MNDALRKAVQPTTREDADGVGAMLGLKVLAGMAVAMLMGPLMGLEVLMGLFEIPPKRRAGAGDKRP